MPEIFHNSKVKKRKGNRKLALVGIIPIKFSSLSAPTKIEELTAGSDEKTQRSLGFDSRRGCAVFFRLIRLSVLLSLSVLKEKRI